MRFLDILNTLHMIQKKTKQVKQIRKDNNTDLDHSIGHKSARGGTFFFFDKQPKHLSLT